MELHWMSVTEALRFFGLSIYGIEDLERIAVDHDIDVELDDEGRIVQLEVATCKAALLAEHEKQIGYRPDDPEHRQKAEQEAAEEAEKAKVRRVKAKKRLTQRVRVRQENSKKSGFLTQRGGSRV